MGTTENLASNPDLTFIISNSTSTEGMALTTIASKENTALTTQKNQPTASPASPIVESSNKSTSNFNGWRFFGGIIVTFGISAIAFVGLKYYRARNIVNQ